MKLKPILFLCALVVLGLTRTTTPAATKPSECQECQVHVWWWSPEGGDGSAVHNVGEPFLTNPDPSIPTVKSFTFPDTNTVVTVLVERGPEDKKFRFIKLGLWTGETEGKRNSESPGWVYAANKYRKGEEFQSLTATKTIQIKNLSYTFEFNCHKPSQKK